MYRDDLAALTARHSALETELAQKTRELDQATRLLEEAQARTKLPVLANIQVAAPCSVPWDTMTGDERVRHCGDCNKNVYNMSELTRDEAEALILEKEGQLCATYFQRHDGTILLKDCAIGIVRRRRRRIIAAGAVALLAGGVGAGYLARRGEVAPEGCSLELAEPERAHEDSYHITQGVEAPPEEEIEIKIIPKPDREEYMHRTAGVVMSAERVPPVPEPETTEE